MNNRFYAVEVCVPVFTTVTVKVNAATVDEAIKQGQEALRKHDCTYEAIEDYLTALAEDDIKATLFCPDVDFTESTTVTEDVAA